MSFSLFLLAALIAAVGGQQSCGSISYTPGPQVTCQPLNTCKGLACSNPIRKRNITFTVQNCTDPVLVNYTIVHSETGTLISTQLINDTFVMGNATHKMSWNVSRNASHLFIQSYITVSGILSWLIPQTVLSLNVTECQCQSIQHIMSNTEAELPGVTTCSNNSQCTGLQCGFNAFSSQFTMESEVVPCNDPPGFILIIKDTGNNVIFDQYFNASRNTTVVIGGIPLPLMVTVVHREYSMIVSVTLTIPGVTQYKIVPKSQVILDKTHCVTSPSQTVTTMTSTSAISLIPSPTNTVVSPETCSALKSIANHSLLSQCSTNVPCDTIQCSVTGYSSNFQILPCHDPPGFHVTMYDPDNRKIYDHIVTNTTTIPVSESNGLYLVMVLERNIVNDTIAVEIKLRTHFFDSVIIPRTVIPLNTCQQCPSAFCNSTSVRQATTSTIELMSPTPTIYLTSTSSTQTSSTQTTSQPPIIVQTPPNGRSDSAATTAAEISIPIVLFIIIVAALVVTAILVVVLLRRKRQLDSGQLRFTSMGDEDEKVIISQPEDADSQSIKTEGDSQSAIL